MVQAGAADLATQAEARALAESAMKLIIADTVNAAFDLITPLWSLPARKIDLLVLKTVEADGSRLGDSLHIRGKA